MKDQQTFQDALRIATGVLALGVLGVVGWLGVRGGPRTRAIRSARGMGLAIALGPMEGASGLAGQVTFHRYLEYDVGLELAERGVELVVLTAQPTNPTSWRAGIVLPVAPDGRFEIAADPADSPASATILVVAAFAGTTETGRDYSGVGGFIAASEIVQIPSPGRR